MPAEPAQTELSLFNVKVMRNDLLEADLEILAPRRAGRRIRRSVSAKRMGGGGGRLAER